MSTIISKEQIAQFERDGFVILRNVISQEMIRKIQMNVNASSRKKMPKWMPKG